MDVEKPKGSLFSAVDAFFSDTPKDTAPSVKEDVSETLNHSNRQPLFGKKLGVGAKLEKRKGEEKDGEFKKRLLSRVSNVKNQSSSRRSKKNRSEDDDDDDDDEQKEPNDEETDDEDEGGRTSVFQQKKKKLPNFAKEDIEIPGSSNKKAKKKKKKGKKERNKEQGEVEEEQKTMEMEKVKDEIEKPPQQDTELLEQEQQQPKRRVRRKVRSKQKNIKKDTRLNSEKPVGLQNPKSSEYTGRPMTQETQKFLGIDNEKKRNWGSFFPHNNSAATGDIGLAVDDWLAVNDNIDENDENKEKNYDTPDSSKKEKKKKKDKKLHKKTKKTRYKNLKF